MEIFSRPRTSPVRGPLRSGLDVDKRLSVQERSPYLPGQLLTGHREEYRPAILSVCNGVDADALVLDHLHLVRRAPVVRLGNKQVGYLHLLGLQYPDELAGFSSPSS